MVAKFLCYGFEFLLQKAKSKFLPPKFFLVYLSFFFGSHRWSDQQSQLLRVLSIQRQEFLTILFLLKGGIHLEETWQDLANQETKCDCSHKYKPGLCGNFPVREIHIE